MFEGLKMRLGFWLIKPPKPPKLRKNTICMVCKEKPAVIVNEWLWCMPMCEQCYNKVVKMEQHIDNMGIVSRKVMTDIEYDKLITDEMGK